MAFFPSGCFYSANPGSFWRVNIDAAKCKSLACLNPFISGGFLNSFVSTTVYCQLTKIRSLVTIQTVGNLLFHKGIPLLRADVPLWFYEGGKNNLNYTYDMVYIG